MKPRLLIRQHRSIERQLRALRVDGGEQALRRAHVIEDLSIHLAAELDVLYPALRRAAVLTSPWDTSGLERVRALLPTIAEGPSAVAFRDSLDELCVVFARHVDSQESDLFPRHVERLDAPTFRQIMEDMAVVSFRLAACARFRAAGVQIGAP